MSRTIYSYEDVRADEHTIADLAEHDFVVGMLGDGECDCSDKEAEDALHKWCVSDQINLLIELVGGMPEAIRQYQAGWAEAYQDQLDSYADQEEDD